MKLKPYFKDNPILKLLTITTIDGDTEYKRNCVSINGKYYVKNKHVLRIDNKWILKSSTAFDYELNKIVFKTDDLIMGIVNFDDINNPTLGYFSKNEYKNCMTKVRTLGTVQCIDYKIIPESFIESYEQACLLTIQ